MDGKPAKTITFRRVVDLTHPIRPGIPLWPGDPPVRFRGVADINSDGYALREFSMGEHSGTHLATPSSVHANGSGPDQIPPSELVVPAVVIDVSTQASRNPDYVLALDDLGSWEQHNGPIPADSLILLFTGWQCYWRDPARFINADGGGIMHTPGFGNDAARFLLEQREAAGLGSDTHGIDAGSDDALSVSRMALRQGALVLECLNNLDLLPPTGATVVVGRLPLVGGSGSPVSALALVP